MILAHFQDKKCSLNLLCSTSVVNVIDFQSSMFILNLCLFSINQLHCRGNGFK